MRQEMLWRSDDRGVIRGSVRGEIESVYQQKQILIYKLI